MSGLLQDGLFPGDNEQVTSSTPKHSRSESCIAVNPLNPLNMVGASKKFTDPAKYVFFLGPVYTVDGGATWHESTLPLKPGWQTMTDPTVAFDHFGNVFLIGEPDSLTTGDIVGLGMVAYRSKDGGKTWAAPVQLATEKTDDKQWVQCDNHPDSPHYGNVYVVWGAVSPLRFARSTNHGNTWTGKAGEPSGSTLVSFCFAPDIAISPDGTLHVFWHDDGGTDIKYIRSTDGGASFSSVVKVATEISSLRGHLPLTNNWPHFDHGKFRVITLATSCAGKGGLVVIAWADMREGRSRIYYRRSLNAGVSWSGPASGKPLLPAINFGDTQCFHPQIVSNRHGVIGCAFYAFGKHAGDHYLIDVKLAGSWNNAAAFSNLTTVTDKPWDPLVNAPFSHGDPAVHFIGEYLGLDADEDFAVLWTDTRTGVQELFFSLVETTRMLPIRVPVLVAEILFGVIEGGGGWVIIGGKLHKIPPGDPPLVTAVEEFVAKHGLKAAGFDELLRGAVGRAEQRIRVAEMDEIAGRKAEIPAADIEADEHSEGT
jgi:hypothetical protein